MFVLVVDVVVVVVVVEEVSMVGTRRFGVDLWGEVPFSSESGMRCGASVVCPTLLQLIAVVVVVVIGIETSDNTEGMGSWS